VGYDKNVLVMSQTDQGGFTCINFFHMHESTSIWRADCYWTKYNEVQLDRQVDILTSDVTKQRRRLRVEYTCLELPLSTKGVSTLYDMDVI